MSNKTAPRAARASAIPMARVGIPEEPGEGVSVGISVGETVGLSVGADVAVGVGVGGESPRPGVGSGLFTNSSPPVGRRSRA